MFPLFTVLIASSLFLQAPARAFLRTPDLSDEFDRPASLADWQRFDQVEGWPSKIRQVAVRDGMLLLEPATSGWYADFQAPFLFKTVSGDFTAETRLHATGLDQEIPKALWSLAGLMVRAPRVGGMAAWTPNTENWLFITTGIAARPGQPVIETKTTVNSRSELRLHPIASGWVELRITRRGAQFALAYKQTGEWQTLATFDRPDLPTTVQLGINAYTDWNSTEHLQNDPKRFNTTALEGSPDLRVLVDYVRVR